MKRNPDLIREILLKVEQSENGVMPNDLTFTEYSKNEVSYHVQLLIEADFIIGNVQYADNRVFYFQISRLTWKGHDFVEAARNDTIWAKAKSRMIPVGNFVLELAKPILIDLIKQQIGIP